MTQFKRVLLLTAAVTLAVSSAEANGRQQPTLKLPAATTARGQALSPSAINRKLAAKRYRVQEMYRNGSAYQVKAIGPSGSKVEMMVDGRSGAILGLNVLSGLAAIANALFGPNHHMHTAYVDDRTPFGAVVPSVVYSKWKPYSPRDWNTGSDYIPVEQGYAPYSYAVPYTYVHTSPQTGRSFAVAPPSYRGYALQDSDGRAVQAAQTRADAADMRAALASERASDSDYRAALAAQDAHNANQNADDMTRIALEQENRANLAEQQNAQLQAQLDSAGTADQAISSAEAERVASENAAPPPAEGPAPEDTSGTDALDDYQEAGNGGAGHDANDDQNTEDNSNHGGGDQSVNDNSNQGSDDQNANDNDNQGGDDQNANDNSNQGGGDQNSNDDNHGNDQNANDGGQGNDDQGTNDGDQGGNDQGSGDDHGGDGQNGDDNN